MRVRAAEMRDAERRCWKYVECSRAWAAGFAGETVRVMNGQAGSLIAKGCKGESTFSAVPSSKRSNEHDAAMIVALLRDVA